jgi:DNA repair exonuclease SbcCD nuclease subunit
MANIALITDTHWGVRSDNQNFYNYQKKFVDNVFLPSLEEYNCEYFIHLGDLVDNRRSINIHTAKRLREDFLNPLKDTQITSYFILGNHDIYYKENKDIHSLKEIIKESEYPRFNVISNPTEIILDKTKILLLPWISPDTRESDLEKITESKSQYCMSHLELKGFEQTKGRLASHGDDHKIFKKFNKVFSGHYHCPSFLDNVHYIGSCFQFNWGDSSNHSGLIILNTDNGEITEIPNPYSMFNPIEYNEDYTHNDLSGIKDTYVSVKIVNKKSEAKFNKFIEKIHEIGIADLQIHENLPPLILSKNPTKANSTLEIFGETISSIDFEDKNAVKSLAEEIYWEAMALA